MAWYNRNINRGAKPLISQRAFKGNTEKGKKTMKKVKIGIIGTGGISNKHIAELLQCEQAQIVALCDVDAKALAEKAKKNRSG